jgi:hypothetical protein
MAGFQDDTAFLALKPFAVSLVTEPPSFVNHRTRRLEP